MPQLTGASLGATGQPRMSYVQLQNLAGDFQGEVRTDADGRLILHAVPGRWRLISWLPAGRRAELEIEIGTCRCADMGQE